MTHTLTCEFVQVDQDGAILSTSLSTAEEQGAAGHAWRERVLSILDNPISARTFLSAGPRGRNAWHVETREDYEFRPSGPGEPFRFTTITRLDYKEAS